MFEIINNNNNNCDVYLLQFNYLTAPANNLNVNLVHHHQQKPFVSHPYSEQYYVESSGTNRALNSSTPNSTIRSVKNYRKPHPPLTNVAATAGMPANYNVVMNTSNTSSYSATNPMTNNLNHSYNTNSYKYSNNVSQSNNLNHSNISFHRNTEQNASNLSRRSSQSSSSHEWMANEKPHSLSLCINRINLKKSNKSSSSAQFQSMRCRKHRNRNHFFNTSSGTSYQKYKLSKSCSNDTVNSEQPELENNPQTTYKFI